MTVSGRRRSIAFAITFGVCLTVLAVTLNVSWIFLNWRTVGTLLLGVIFFLIIIAGLILNTIYLVREIRRNEQHDAFINAVTHELKTPVASIRLYLQTLQARPVDDVKRQEFYGIMLSDTDRLIYTIEQVLQAGRASTKQKLLLRSRIDLASLVQECVALARRRHRLPDDALHYRYSLPAHRTAVVIGDEDELQAVVLNLIDNAIKYSKENIKVDIEVDQPDPHRVAVRVTDRGIGISRAELGRIFKRFYRIPDSMVMRVKGTGLGLFIVRSIVERHGGKAYADSDGPGHGSTFTITLPLAPAEP